jgi:hypothetical protein
MERTDEGGRERRLYGILLEYLEAAERGESVDPAGLLAGHPEFAAELQAFLEGWDRLERLTAPLRRAARAGDVRRPRGEPNGSAAPWRGGPG